MRPDFTCLFCVAAIIAGPAGAATTSGIVDPDGDGMVSVSGPAPGGPGVYRLRFAVSRPATGSFTAIGQLNGEFFDAVTGDYAGGNDTPFEPGWSYAVPVTSASLLFKVPRPTMQPFGEFIYREFYSYDRTQLDLTFADAGPVTYTISSDYLTAVPEPATWAMMIAGFGVTGMAIRRRTRADGEAILPAG